MTPPDIDPPPGAPPPPNGAPPPAGGFTPGRGPKPASDFVSGLGDWLQRALPHLKEWNAQVAAWAAEASWKRISLLGLVIFIASVTIGNILGIDEPTEIVTGPDKPIKIEVKDDTGGLTIQPSFDGKPSKPMHIDLPKAPPVPPATPGGPGRDPVDKEAIRLQKDGKEIVIDSHGVRILDEAANKAPGAADKGAAASHADGDENSTEKDAQAAREDAEQQRALAEQQRSERKEEYVDAVKQAQSEIQEAIDNVVEEHTKRTVVHRESVALWDFFKVVMTIAFAYLIAIKVSMSNKRRAEALVRSASQVAEHESLQRQVVEARMQMMQAQVEPHFLFNTLSSVDYLIETDPARASTMQKNLIQYLRAALPQMRESSTTLGREVELVRAYLDILKVRMEERLQVFILVPEGLRSAEFPPMMLQSLVENAIKHGLEPKAEGGSIRIQAEVADGDLYVTIADTGLGFNPAGAPTSGGGLGLANIRERLNLLYGGRARFVITANEPSGTSVAVIVPYQPAAKRG